MMLGVLINLPSFYGFWEIGRAVTMNPLETAKAFDAPLLRTASSNAAVDRMKKELSDVKVRYGEVFGEAEDHCRLMLKFDLQEKIVKPRPGIRYQ
jgi:hypothetical protein